MSVKKTHKRDGREHPRSESTHASLQASRLAARPCLCNFAGAKALRHIYCPRQAYACHNSDQGTSPGPVLRVQFTPWYGLFHVPLQKFMPHNRTTTAMLQKGHDKVEIQYRYINQATDLCANEHCHYSKTTEENGTITCYTTTSLH